MAIEPRDASPVRPERVKPEDVPPLPDIEGHAAEEASTIFSRFRTKLSRRRTNLSEHRTDLSEFRTDLSTHRTELSMRRTGMSIHRTRMSADRTLMSEIRTALSMIGFGFTLYQAFAKLTVAGVTASANAPRNFGLILIVLGMIILTGGIWRHIQFALELRRMRKLMIADSLIHGETKYPVSISFLVAIGLFFVGVLAILNVGFGFELFG